MRRIFLQFYVLLLACFLLVSLLLGIVYKKAIDDLSENYLGDLLSAVLVLTEQELHELPPEQWQLSLDKHDLDTEFNLAIQPLNSYMLDDDSSLRLGKGEIVLSPHERVYLKKIDNSDYILVAGPIDYTYFLEQLKWLDYILLLVICLALAIPVFVWMRPHWRDLMRLENAAEKVSRGQFETHVQLTKQSSIHSIGRAFNHMTRTVQRLLLRQETLIGDIAHEVRTPIARLRYRLALLELKDVQKSGLQSDIDEIDNLIEELLLRVKINTVDAVKIPFNAQNWLSERVEQAKITAHTDIVWTIQVDELTLLAEHSLMTRALDNLLNNARRFAQKSIVVRAYIQDGTYCIVVEDDGIGIPKEQQDSVFEPFFRLDNSRTRNTGGHGLGLSIVASVASAHNGSVRVQDSLLGGAMFVLTWPQ